MPPKKKTVKDVTAGKSTARNTQKTTVMKENLLNRKTIKQPVLPPSLLSRRNADPHNLKQLYARFCDLN